MQQLAAFPLGLCGQGQFQTSFRNCDFHPGGVDYSYEPIRDRGYTQESMVPILPGLAMMLHLASSEHKMEWFENVLDESVFEATVINSVVSSLQRVHYNMHVPISARNQEN